MPHRECSYSISKGVEANIPPNTIEELIKQVVDEAYDKNMELKEQVHSKRFQLWTVKGKIATGNELINAVHNNPEEIGYLLPIVLLWEQDGKDQSSVTLHTEILENPVLMDNPEIRHFAEQPPLTSVNDIIQSIKK